MASEEKLTLSDLGEFGFIEILRSMFPRHMLEKGLVLGIGDDVAVLDVKSESYLLATCDVQIGHIHFLPSLIKPYDLGIRTVEINASDIAAMGGVPQWALVGLNVPSETEITFLEEFYRGVRDDLMRFGALLVGGNCAKTEKEIVIDLFLLGFCGKENFITRKGASSGDLIVATGSFGKGRAGLEVALLEDKSPFNNHMEKDFVKKVEGFYFTPQARFRESQVLVKTGCIKAMIDVSDGLFQDLEHLCQENGLDAVLDPSSIPLDPAVELVASAVGANPLEWALSGGEDYELAFAVSEKDFPKLLRIFSDFRDKEDLAPISPIGYFQKGRGRVVLKNSSIDINIVKGWDHYRRNRL